MRSEKEIRERYEILKKVSEQKRQYMPEDLSIEYLCLKWVLGEK